MEVVLVVMLIGGTVMLIGVAVMLIGVAVTLIGVAVFSWLVTEVVVCSVEFVILLAVC